MTIDLNFATLIPALAEQHLVIGVEAQGHGRTADTGRPITPAALASDVIGLLDHLGIDRAHVLGHSQGAAVTVERFAATYPQRVRSIVPISASVRAGRNARGPDRSGEAGHVHAHAHAAGLRRLHRGVPAAVAAPGALRRVPGHASSGQRRPSRLVGSAAAAGITAPTLIVQGDHDFVTAEAGHAALMQQLIPGSQLAVLPGTTHMQITRRADVLLPILGRFLD